MIEKEVVLTYFLLPLVVLPILSGLIYQILSIPLGWILLPGAGLVTYWYQTSVTRPKKIINGDNYNVIVVGGGMSGLCAGAKLAQAGVPFTIFESGHEVGGTWHYNTYPGCACDVWTTLYQFTFFPNPDWSRFVATAAEIKQYLETFARKYDLYPHIQFNTTVTSATWRPEDGVWKVVTNQGVLKCRILISACGALHQPLLPQIEGIHKFRGDSFHSSNWNHNLNLTGKKVGIVGSAASAVQIAPKLADNVGSLYVFQRTPNWYFPKFDPVYPEYVKKVFRTVPFTMTLMRWAFFLLVEGWSMVWLHKSFVSDLFQKVIEAGMRKQAGNEALAQKLIPKYKLGCKRILLTSEFVPLFNKHNCHLITDQIEQITSDGVETSSEHIELDTIVYATGFDIEASFCPFDTFGRNSLKLREYLHENPCAYLGMTVPEFPNFFFLLGPNTVLAHSSVIYMIECQVDYVIKSINLMANLHIKSMEPRRDKTEDYQEKMGTWTLNKNFSTNCKSWYKNKDGKNFVLWPSNLLQYWRMTFSPNLLEDYKLDFFTDYFSM